MAIVGMDVPDFRTANTVRNCHLNALRGMFGQVLGLCADRRGWPGWGAWRWMGRRCEPMRRDTRR